MRILGRYHEHAEPVPFAFNPHAFGVINQQVDTEAGRVLGGAGLCFAVVPLLIHHAI